jgi:hypothetical protein
MPNFKTVVFAEGQLPFTVACSFDAVNSAFDGQCFHTMFWPDKFIQHCLGLVRLFTTVFNDFFPTVRTAETAETTAP